jgi:hypothetical protein
MPNMLTELGSPMMMNNGETYQISFANIPAGSVQLRLPAAHRHEHEGRHHGPVRTFGGVRPA